MARTPRTPGQTQDAAREVRVELAPSRPVEAGDDAKGSAGGKRRASSRGGTAPSPQPSPEGRGSSAGGDPDIRRTAIRSLIKSKLIATQEELRELLAADGYDVTQATLSRDLAQIGARRVSLPEGGTAYEVDEARVPEGPDALLPYRDMILSVVETDALVIVHTLPGAASAVAVALDRARLQQIAGTIAGDDCIFIAPSKGVAPGRISRQLNTLWSKGRT